MERNALDACFITGLEVDDFIFPVAPFNKAAEHTQQHGAPVAGLCAAGSGVDGKIHVFPVKFAGKKTQDLIFIKLFADSESVTLSIGQKFRFFCGHFNSFPQTGNGLLKLDKRIKNAAAGGKFTYSFLSGFFVIPEIGSCHFVFKFLKLRFESFDPQKIMQMGNAPGHIGT